MGYKKGYFDSGVMYNSQKGLYKLRNSTFLKSIIEKKSKQHYDLLLVEKWKFLRNCRKVLDAGCGRGQFIKLNPFGADVSGIDFIESDIDKLKKEGFNVKCVDLKKKLPYKNSSFDGIISSHVLEHIDNPDMMLSEFKRILKKEGILLIAVPNFSFEQFYKDPTHKRPYPKEAIFRLLSDYGFHDIKIVNGPHLNKTISAIFFLSPKIRHMIEKLLGKINPWEILAIAKNTKKD